MEGVKNFRPSVDVSRDGLLKSCACHGYHHGGSPLLTPDPVPPTPGQDLITMGIRLLRDGIT